MLSNFDQISEEDLIERDEYEPETPTQKRIRLVRERKQKFNKNLKSFIGGVK